MDPAVWTQFLLTALVVELTPGPNMGWLMALRVAKGPRAALSAVAGVAAGMSVLALAGALLAGEATGRFHIAAHGLQWAGVALMTFMTAEAWRGPKPDADPSGDLRHAFLRGFGTNVLNPKTFAFVATVVPALAAGAGRGGMLVFAGAYVAVAAAVHLSIVALAGRIAGSAAAQKPAALVAAVAMSAVTVWLAWGAWTAA
jgi:threonine/homoserine/homoserine lactone efflux protein